MDNLGQVPWYAELTEPTGNDDHPSVDYLGPLYVADAFAARLQALRFLCDDAYSYRAALRDPVGQMTDYSEQPAPPNRAHDGSGGMDIAFDTPAGDKVRVRIRPGLVAHGMGWPSVGEAHLREAYEDSDSEEERYPDLVEEWPGWGRYEGSAEDVSRLQIENQIFWGADQAGYNGFELLEQYKVRPAWVIRVLSRAGVRVSA